MTQKLKTPPSSVNLPIESVAWLLVGHGTKSQRGLAEFHETVELVANRATGRLVRHAFLELAEPTIESSVTQLYDAQVRQLFVVPAMLFAAGHIKSDVPAEISRAAQNCTGLAWRLAGHLGCHPKIVELSLRRFFAVRDELGGCDTLVLVGRGSQDEAAIAEMAQFARLHSQRSRPSAMEIAYVAMASPQLDDVLENVGDSRRGERIIVQPHLLFHGEILDHVQQSVRNACRRYPNKQWRCAEHLGPSPELAESLLDLAQQAASGYDQ
jgi:sirohydrochlorin ferrochelatase